MTLSLVNNLYKKKKYDDALKLCNVLMEEQNESYELFELRSSVFARLNQTEAAIEDLDRVIELMPNNSAPHFRKARYLMKVERNNEAVYHLSEAENMDNGYFGETIFFIRAIAHLRQKKYDDALNDVNKISNDFDQTFGIFGYKSILELREAINSQ